MNAFYSLRYRMRYGMSRQVMSQEWQSWIALQNRFTKNRGLQTFK